MPEATVLVVDDDEDLCLAIARRLAREGFQVQTAMTGSDCLLIYERQRPDLVVLDLGLPDMEGLEVCRRLKATGDAWVLILTGRTDEEEQIAGLEAGADDYVPKPVSLSLLTSRVRALLRRRPPTRAPAVAGGGGEPLAVGQIAPQALHSRVWVEERAEAEKGEAGPPSAPVERAALAGAVLFAKPGELWRVDQRWHLVNQPQTPATDLQLRRMSMGLVEAGFIVEILAEASWTGAVKEVYLYDATVLEEVREPIARGYLLTDLYRQATLLQGIEGI